MYNKFLYIKISQELQEKMKSRAKENCQTISDYVRSLIVKDLKGN